MKRQAGVELPNARVQPDVGVDGEIQFPEWNRRILEDCTSHVVERAVALLIQLPNIR